jgi:hypothetical protein
VTKAAVSGPRGRCGLVRLTTEDLLALECELRKRQKPRGRVFWRLERLIGRIDDEVVRRAT